MSGRGQLTREEAESFTRSLRQMVVGHEAMLHQAIHVLRVPEALGLTPEEWAKEMGGEARFWVKALLAAEALA